MFDWINYCVPYLKKGEKMSEREKTFLHYVSIFFFSLADLVLKIIPYFYVNNNIFAMTFYQSLAWIPLSLFDIKNFGYEIKNFFFLEHRICIIFRGLSICAINIFITLAIYHIKFAIVISILFSNHIINSLFSFFYFKEKFYLRYIIGLSLSFVGMLLFAFNGEEEKLKKINDNADPLTGVFFALMSSLSVTVLTVVNKILKDYEPCVLNLHSGIIGSLFSLPFLFFLEKFEYSIIYILLNFFNSIFFYVAYTFLKISLIYNSLIFISSINFSSIVFAFVYGFIFFGENLCFQELMGVLIIISYNVWSLFNPIKDI